MTAPKEVAPWMRLPNNTVSPFYADAGLRKLTSLTTIVMLSTFIIGFDGSLIASLLAIPAWHENIGNPDANLLGLVIAAQSFGGLVAFIPSSWAMDKFGRRKLIMFGDIVVLSAAIGQLFCFSAGSFLATRLVLGIGTVITLCASPVLLSELCHPRLRGPAVAVAGTFFYVGAVASAWVGFGSLHLPGKWAWRVPVLCQIIAPIIQFCLMPLVPESPRWQIARGEVDTAKATLAKYHANGDLNDPLVNFEIEEITQTLEREATGKVGWSALISTPANRKRTILTVAIAVIAQWSGNGIISYYFPPVLATVGITSPSQQAGINCGLQMWNWIWAMIGSLSVDRFGRRGLLLTSLGIMFVSMAIVGGCSAAFASSGSKGAGYAVIVFLFIFNAGYDIAMTPLPTLYTTEVMPYYLRAKGMSLNFMVAFSTGFLNQYANPLALAKIAWKFYFVYVALVAIFAVMVYSYFPETSGLSIEEVARLFEGGEAITDIERKQHVDHLEKTSTGDKSG